MSAPTTPSTNSRDVGAFRVHALVDVAGPIDTTLHEAFPDATQEQWTAARTLDPTTFGPADAWVLPFRAFVVVAPDDHVTIVDLGVGTAASPAASWAPGPGRLPEGLAARGISPADVGTVVLTHLHEDHVGWVLGPAGIPLFARADHVIQTAEVAAVAGDRAIVEATVDPLRIAGLLREIDGPYALRPGVDVEPTPGHTPGHQSVWLSSGGEELLLTGDVLVHAVQLLFPEIPYAAEDDPAAATATRERVYAEARRRGASLATAHLTEPFVGLP
jgi:glyoxylase-like metal-dependent hydrolase (beta-lactamase superfamily II)